MAKKKLFEDILKDPTKFYRVPIDVLRDRRFDDGQRVEILKAWIVRDPQPSIQLALEEAESRQAHA